MIDGPKCLMYDVCQVNLPPPRSLYNKFSDKALNYPAKLIAFSDKTHSRWLIGLPLIALMILPFWVGYQTRNGLSYDDAYITLTYARNVAEGRGFVYNGGVPYLGTTTPLLTLILAAIGRSLPFVSIPVIAVWFGALMWSLSTLLSFLIGRRCMSDAAGLLLAGLMATNSIMLDVMSAEFPLLAALSLTAIFFAMKQRQWLAGIALGLAYLSRADAAILAGIIGLALLWQERRFPWRLTAGFLIPVIPWSLYAYFVFENPLPATLEVKRAHRALGAWPHIATGFKNWFSNSRWWFRWYYTLSVSLSLLGLIGFIKARALWPVVIILWGIAYTVAYIILNVPFYVWYAIIVFTSLSLGAGLTLVAAVRMISGHFAGDNTRTVRYAGLALTMALLLFLLALGFYGLTDVERKSVVRPKTEAYVNAGHWLRQNTPKGSTVGFIEVGWVAYYSERQILDLLGLVTPGTTPYIIADAQADLLKALQPDYYLRNRNFDGWGMNKRVHDSYYFQTNFSQINEIPQRNGLPIAIYQRNNDIDNPAFGLFQDVASQIASEPGLRLSLSENAITDFTSSQSEAVLEAIENEPTLWLAIQKPIYDYDLASFYRSPQNAVRLEFDDVCVFWISDQTNNERLTVLRNLGLMNNVDPNQLINLWREEGVRLRQEQRFVEAIDTYHNILALLPNDGDASLGLAAALLGLGRHAEALPHLEQAKAALPHNLWAYRLLGNVHMQLGDYALAVENLAAAYDLDASDPQLLLSLARASIKAGHQDKARDILNQSLQREDVDLIRAEIDLLSQELNP